MVPPDHIWLLKMVPSCQNWSCSFLLLTTPCWCCLLLSFYNARECSTCIRTIFGRGGPILAANSGPPGPIFTPDQNFCDTAMTMLVNSKKKISSHEKPQWYLWVSTLMFSLGKRLLRKSFAVRCVHKSACRLAVPTLFRVWDRQTERVCGNCSNGYRSEPHKMVLAQGMRNCYTTNNDLNYIMYVCYMCIYNFFFFSLAWSNTLRYYMYGARMHMYGNASWQHFVQAWYHIASFPYRKWQKAGWGLGGNKARYHILGLFVTLVL